MKKSELKAKVEELSNLVNTLRDSNDEAWQRISEYEKAENYAEREENYDYSEADDNDDGAYDENYQDCDCEVCRCDRGENLDNRDEYSNEQPREDELSGKNTIYVDITLRVRYE